MALGAQPLADRRALPALPDDGAMDGTARLAIPDDGGLTLVGDADRRHVTTGESGGAERLRHHLQTDAPDLFGIVLDPARLRIVLRDLGVGPAAHGAVARD